MKVLMRRRFTGLVALAAAGATRNRRARLKPVKKVESERLCRERPGREQGYWKSIRRRTRMQLAAPASLLSAIDSSYSRPDH
jgi:hypothetical protein